MIQSSTLTYALGVWLLGLHFLLAEEALSSWPGSFICGLRCLLGFPPALHSPCVAASVSSRAACPEVCLLLQQMLVGWIFEHVDAEMGAH